MIYEMRTYEVPPGRANEFLRFYEKNGLPIKIGLPHITIGVTNNV